MPQTVSIPNFGDIDFPDDMAPDAIQAAVRKSVFDLEPLPHAGVQDLSKDQFLDRRFTAAHNLSFAFQDLQRESDTFDEMAKGVQDGSAEISLEDLNKASARVKLLQERFKIAQSEAEAQTKDHSGGWESFKAQFAQVGENTKAAAYDLITPDQPNTELESAQARLNYARKLQNDPEVPSWVPGKDPDYIKGLEKEVDFLGLVPNDFQKKDPHYQSRQGARDHFQRLAEEHRQEAAGMFDNFAASEFSSNPAAQFGRGTAKVLPAMAIGAINLPASVLQMAGEGYESTYTNRRAHWESEGKSKEEADSLAQTEATDETLKSVPALAAYTVGGKLTSGALARFLPAKSPIWRGLAGAGGASAMNVGISAAMGHYTDGHRIEQLTQDLGWGLMHGTGEFRTAREALEIIKGEGSGRGAKEMQRLMTLSVDNSRSQIADSLESQGGAENLAKAKALRFQEGEDQRMALKKVEQMRTEAAQALGKAGKPYLDEIANAKFPFKPDGETPAPDLFTEAMQAAAPKVGPATQAAVADLAGKPAVTPPEPAPAVVMPTPAAPAAKKEESPAAPETPAPAEEPAPVEPATETKIDKLQTVEVPIARLKLSDDVPQFKAGADATTGVVEPLGGKFDRRGVGPIQVWERLNGNLEVITGRHRFDLAQRSGEETIPAQIHREADGFTAEQAAILDAELNIRDGQGSVSDYASYFRGNSELTQEDAQARGLLARAKGRVGFEIGKRASEDVFSLHQSGKLSDAKAAAIVNAAPGDSNLQRLAVKFVTANPHASAGEIGHYLNATAAFQKLGEFTIDAQGDLFGTSDASINAADKAAEVAKQLEAKAKEDVRILETALKRAGQLKLTEAEAARFGVGRDDTTAIKAALERVKGAAEGWDAWHLDEAKKAAVFALAGVRAKPTVETGQGEAPARAGAPKEDLFAGREDDVFNLTAESAQEKAAREAREAADAKAKQDADAAKAKIEAEKQQAKLFEPVTPEVTPVKPKPTAEPVSKTPPKPAAKPVEPPVSKPAAAKERVRLGASPQTFTVEAELPAQKGDLPGEKYFRVKNERTGEVQTVEAKDLRPLGKKGKQAVEIEAAAEKTLGQVPDAPAVQVFENAGDIPAELGGDAPNVRQAKADGNIIEGWHAVMPDGRRVVVLNKDGIAKVAEQMGISVEQRAHQVTLHELGHDRQHIGALLPAKDRRAYDSVVGGVLSRDQATAAEISKLYGYDLGTREGRAKTAEEMLVREGEKPMPAAWYHRAIAALVDIFRALGYKGKLTESELRSMLDYSNRGRVDARRAGRSGDVALSQQRAQVGGEPGVGHEYNPRDIAQTRQAVREGTFDSTQPVSEARTAKAWDLIESLTDLESGRAYTTAGDIVQAAGGSDIATATAKVELMNYAAKLAGEGDGRMINHLLATVNLMPNTQMGAGESTAGAVLRARKELESGLWKAVIGQAEATDTATARMLAGRSPTNADIDFIRRLKGELAGQKAQPVEAGDTLPGTKGEDLNVALTDQLRAAGVHFDNPMLQALVQIAKNGYDNGRQFTFTASNEPVATASAERRAAVAKLLKPGDNFRADLEGAGADALEGAFWKGIDAPKEEGPLNEIDRAQNAQLANVVKETLSKMGIEAPKGNKMTDAEKVAAMLNKRPLDEAKRAIADERIKAEIEARRERDLKAATDDAERMGVDAYYSNLRDAWDTANKRATAIPVSDSMMRRLVGAELKSKENPDGVDMTAAVRSTDPRDVATARKTAVDAVVAKVDAASWPGRDYATLRSWLESTFDRTYAARRAKWEASQAREAARRAAGIKPDDAAGFIIESLARSQSDTHAWPKAKENDVRRIVRQALQEHGPENSREAWFADMKAKLMNAGVSEPVADSLAARVQRERQVRESNRTMKAYERAAEGGALAPIVDAINETPLSQRDGAWIARTVENYLTKAGLDPTQAKAAAQIFGPAIQRRMEEAQVRAFEKSVKESDTYKASVERNPSKAKSDLDKILGAVRSGAADPSATFTSKLAAVNGWKGFTNEQYKRMAELDTIYSDPQTLPYKRTQAASELMAIAAKTGAPPAFLRSLNEYYTANALSGIPTDAINVASPGIFLVRDAITDALTGIYKGPAHVESVVKSLFSALDGYVGELAFAAKSDSYGHHSNEWFDHQSALKRKLDDGLARLKAAKGIGPTAAAVKDIFFGAHDYIRRALSTLDQGAISVLEQYNLSRYAMAELRRRGLDSQQINTVLETVIETKNRFFADARAKGMGWAEAKTAANDFARDCWVKALDAQGVKGSDVSLSAINDALRAVGRVGRDSEGNRLRDVGMLSSPMMALIDAMAGVSKSHPGVGLVYKALFGFFATAARTVHGAAWYSPYGFVRLAADRAFKKAGADSPYSQTLATDQQMRQRLRDAFAGTLALAVLTPLMTSSADNDDKKTKITITGNGPATDDPMVREAWLKTHKPNALEVSVGGRTLSVNLGRSGEAVMPALMLAGALDDLALRRKHEQGKGKPRDLDTALTVGSSLWYQFSNRGPYSALQRAGNFFPKKDNPNSLADLAGQVGYSAKPFVPLLGSTLAKNISDLFTEALDKSTVPAAMTANIPFVGPAVNEPALNRLGDPIGDGGFDAKLWKLGVPAVVSLPDDSPDRLAYDLIRRQGQGPPSLTRKDVESRYSQPLSDKQWRQFIQIQGHALKDLMIDNYDKLIELPPDQFNAQLSKWAETAEKKAAVELDLAKEAKGN